MIEPNQQLTGLECWLQVSQGSIWLYVLGAVNIEITIGHKARTQMKHADVLDTLIDYNNEYTYFYNRKQSQRP